MSFEPKKRSKKFRPYTEQELQFIRAYKGTATAAAREIGMKPSNVSRLLKRKHVQEAIEDKMRYMFAEWGRKDAVRAEKSGYTLDNIKARLWDLARTPPALTNNSMSGQVSACMTLGKWQGAELKNTADMLEMFRERSYEDNLFFATHGYFPEDAVGKKKTTGGSEKVQ